jgi:glycine/D-amino acid oxidase-like deaminating enzyme/nitrite reductase/ring-hydroxylating ferredoxin subunit
VDNKWVEVDKEEVHKEVEAVEVTKTQDKMPWRNPRHFRLKMTEHNSYWLAGVTRPDYPPLRKDLSVDVVVIGGGIAGIMTAFLLKEQGKSVALVEKNHLLGGVTGHTTGKLTSLHNLIYDYLISQFGREKAKLYADANQAAIEKVASLTQEMKIDSDFQRTNAYTYAASKKEKEMVQKEVEAAQSLGLPASFVEKTDLPFETQGAVCLANQAIYHPVKFLLALVETLPGNESYIFENTRALSVEEGEPNTVTTDKGQIKAKDVVVATNFPIHDKCSFFTKMWPKRSYVLAVRLKEKTLQGYYISAAENYYSVRPHFPDDNLVLIGGESHKTGQGGDTIKRYQNLEDLAKKRFKIASVDYRWSTQDNFPDDRIPFIGRASSHSKHIWVATGFKGWGMSHGIVSGMLLSDLILGKDNPWEKVFDPCRSVVKTGATTFAKQNLNVGGQYIAGHLSEERDGLEGLKNGEGKILEVKGNKVAAYRDDQGKLYTLSPVCQHLGCIVSWNNAEKSWDCPCHGSRYRFDGKVIHSPTVKDLGKIEV